MTTRRWLAANLAMAAIVLAPWETAHAHGGGGAAWTTTFKATPGISTTPTNVSYSITPIQLSGTFGGINEAETPMLGDYIGHVTTSPLSGGSAGETTAFASGSLNNFTFSGETIVNIDPFNRDRWTISGGNVGPVTFTRAGSLVIISTRLTYTIHQESFHQPLAGPAVTVDKRWTGSPEAVLVGLWHPLGGQNGLAPAPGGNSITDATMGGFNIDAG